MFVVGDRRIAVEASVSPVFWSFGMFKKQPGVLGGLRPRESGPYGVPNRDAQRLAVVVAH